MNNLHQLTSVGRLENYTVFAASTSAATSVTSGGASATLYGDNAFAKESLTLTNGANSFTAIGSDSSSRLATNTVSGSFGTSASTTYDNNGNLLTEGDRRYAYDDENQLIRIRGTNWTDEYSYDGRNRRRVKRNYQTAATTPVITSATLGTLTSLASARWSGFYFTVGSKPVLVTDLGRWKVSGNSGTHTVKITTLDLNPIDIPGASVSVSLAPVTAGQFAYAALPQPVLPNANTTYARDSIPK